MFRNSEEFAKKLWHQLGSLVEDEDPSKRDFFKVHVMKAEARLREGGGLSLLSLSREKLGAGERGGASRLQNFVQN